jgi:hypothetical protein
VVHEFHVLVLGSVVEGSVAPSVLGIDLFWGEFGIEGLEGGVGVFG